MTELSHPPFASLGGMFATVYGRNLVAELANFVHQPSLVVTMEDLWELFSHHFSEGAVPYPVKTIDGDELKEGLASLPTCNAVVGLGGGQAVDVAKFFA